MDNARKFYIDGTWVDPVIAADFAPEEFLETKAVIGYAAA
jgi:hypothetical protein